MSRTTRTLLVLGLMAVGAVVALAFMAQRYGDVLGRRQAAATAGRGGDGEVLPAAQAERLVAAYLTVLRELSTTEGDGRLDRALAGEGIDRVTFQELDGVARAWTEGSSEVPRAYRDALEARAAEVRELLAGGYEPRGP